jgi:proline dehydrogenase
LGSFDHLKNYTSKPKKEGFFIETKLVRMLTWKREMFVPRKSYPSPICASKEAYRKNYDAVRTYMIEHLDMMSILQEHIMS